jgi:hypothetical protein
VDLWLWRFVVGFTWWQPAFKMQIKLHVFCKGNIHILQLKHILMKFVQIGEEKTASLSNLGFEQVRFTI